MIFFIDFLIFMFYFMRKFSSLRTLTRIKAFREIAMLGSEKLNRNANTGNTLLGVLSHRDILRARTETLSIVKHKPLESHRDILRARIFLWHYLFFYLSEPRITLITQITRIKSCFTYIYPVHPKILKIMVQTKKSHPTNH